MCGIFGVACVGDSTLDGKGIRDLMANLFRSSESRGKEAAGIAVRFSDRLKLYKTPQPASKMIKSSQYREIIDATIDSKNTGGAVAMIGHSRLVTNGNQSCYENNQPLAKGDAVAVHNGIVVNADELWEQNHEMTCETELDSEVILGLLDKYQRVNGLNPVMALNQTFDAIEGMASLAILFRKLNSLLLATNNGSIYYCIGNQSKSLVFASERFILESVLKSRTASCEFSNKNIQHLAPGCGLAMNLADASITNFILNNSPDIDLSECKEVPVEQFHPGETADFTNKNVDIAAFTPERFSRLEKEYDRCRLAVSYLRRCTSCALPETIPFIDFDKGGVCNYCRGYQPIENTGRKSLEDELSRYRKGNGEPDCIVAFSGGRDSSYGLHYLKKELGMTPLAYTYDWGMVTDLARRNQSRMCGDLGVEHIVVSADISKKRDNIRRNVSAWLKKPDLGMVPLFMAGDKQFFYYANEIRKQNNVDLVIFSENLLEKTYFKTGFCDINPNFGQNNTYTLGLGAKAKLMSYYGRQFLMNPEYFNRSLIDTLGAYLSYYAIPHNFLWMFQYLPWKENQIDQILLNDYGWETAPDTKTTWRIGDGTAPFYNYIYYIMAGFTENDTFRSNQIREGHLSREEALRLIERDNMPRFESIHWYCDAIGIDLEQAMAAIHNAPKQYLS